MKKYIVLNDKGYPTFPIYFEGDNIPSTAIPMTDDDEYHYLSNEYKVNGEWVKAPAEPIPLERLKQAKLMELKQARDNAEALPITTDKGTFDFDDISRTRLDIALKVLTLSDTTLEWTLADNTTVEVTADDINTIFVNSAIRSNDLHNTYRDLKAQVMGATTPDEVQEVVWSND